MNGHYYNTTSQTGQTLIDFEEKAKSLEEKVYQIFKSNPSRGFAWHEAKQELGEVNEVSLKRCLSNLKNALKLEKTDEKVITVWGKPAHRYKLI